MALPLGRCLGAYRVMRYGDAASLKLCRRLKVTLAIVRETKHMWERRVPLLPEHVEKLIKDHGVEVIMQPSWRRCVRDAEYARVGAKIKENITGANVLLGIKEMHVNDILPNATHVFFSHTHKGQPYNMGMLGDILKKRARLIDYELMTESTPGKGLSRIVKFGLFAGYAGAVDALHVLGKRLLGLGYSTPFLHVATAHTYPSLADAMNAVKQCGARIKAEGLPLPLNKLCFVVTGGTEGSVASGARAIFELLPHKTITPKDLPSETQSNPKTLNNEVVFCIVGRKDYYSKDEKTGASVSTFHQNIAPYASVLLTGHYWDPSDPRLLTCAQAKELSPLWAKGNRMIVLADVSCDIKGGIEFTSHATHIDDPFFMYNPTTQTEHKDIAAAPGSIAMISVDILPTELPLDASRAFGNALMRVAPALVSQRWDDPILRRATITESGALLPPHKWLEKKLPKAAVAATVPFSSDAKETVKTKNNGNCDSGQKIESSNCGHALVLGSGLVVGPLVEYLLSRPNCKTIVTVASDNLEQAKLVAAAATARAVKAGHCFGSARAVELKGLPKNTDALKQVIKDADVVVSMLPASMHAAVASECVLMKKHMVTASYTCQGMQRVSEEAKRAGVTLITELGVDPGIDHATIQSFIDNATSRGARVVSLKSYCGGLPAPEHAGENPMAYLFSWSPRAALTACLNPATFLLDSKKRTVEPGFIATAAQDFFGVPGLALEVLPNRDSMKYLSTYNMDSDIVTTMFRGTLRYRSFSSELLGLLKTGLFDTTTNLKANIASCEIRTWGDLVRASTSLIKKDASPDDRILALKNSATANWLEISETADLQNVVAAHSGDSVTPFDLLCVAMQPKMMYTAEQRDMVIMHHEFVTVEKDGMKKRETATMVEYGEAGGPSAMARTVGLPAGIAAGLVLDSKITQPGLLHPTHPEVYKPLISKLTAHNIKFKTTTSTLN